MSYLSVGGHGSSSSTMQNESENKAENDDLEVDNSKSVLLKIATLYAEQLMSDLVLMVGGVAYPAHRLILCASSEVFQVMLMNREWTEWRESKIVLQETPTATAVFPHFLKYFYTGQIKISHQSVLPILSLADKYNVKDLVSLCLCYMSNHIAQAAKRDQLISWMQYTMACGHNYVAKACQNFLKWNIEWKWSESELAQLEGETLTNLLQHNDLVLHNEMALYDFVVRWLSKQRERLNSSGLSETDIKAHWESLVTAVFSHIRFPMMCPNQLAKLLLNPLTQEHKEFFMERMAIAMSYQSDVLSARSSLGWAGGALLTPRLYTADTCCSQLSVDNFHALPSYHASALIFSTRTSMADVDKTQDRPHEWTLELYPKGVWFRKSLLIGWAHTYDVPEVVLRTVRISLTCHSVPEPQINEYGEPQDEPDIRVKIGILVWGVQKGVEHVSTVVERIHRFSAQNRVLNIDDALDFDTLNNPLYCPPNDSAKSTANSTKHARCVNCDCCCNVTDEPKHLLGPNADQLRIQVVIVPLTKDCQIGNDHVVM